MLADLTAAYTITALSDRYAATAAAVIGAPIDQLEHLRAQRDEARREYLQAFYAAHDAQRRSIGFQQQQR